MAVFHATVKAHTRSRGDNAVAAAAYRWRLEFTDASDPAHPKHFDYRPGRNGKVATDASEFAAMIGTDLAPEAFWSAVERAETRKNSMVSREVEVALPLELSKEENIRVARSFAEWLSTTYHTPVDLSVHYGRNGDRPHAHIGIPTRFLEMTPDGPRFAAKMREWNDKKTSSQIVETIRAKWAETVNQALMEKGVDVRIDHRSYARQGIDKIPAKHLSKWERALEARGVRTLRGDFNRAAKELNDIRDLKMEVKKEEETMANNANKRGSRRRSRRDPSEPLNGIGPDTPRPGAADAFQKGAEQADWKRPSKGEQDESLRRWLASRAYGPRATLLDADFYQAVDGIWTKGYADKGTVKFRLAGDRGRLIDDGSAITFETGKSARDDDPQAIKAMITVAKAKGWGVGDNALNFTGSKEFREAAAREATRQGLAVSNPDLQKVVEEEKRRLAEADRIRQAEIAAEQKRQAEQERAAQEARRQAQEREAETRRQQAEAERKRLAADPAYKAAGAFAAAIAKGATAEAVDRQLTRYTGAEIDAMDAMMRQHAAPAVLAKWQDSVRVRDFAADAFQSNAGMYSIRDLGNLSRKMDPATATRVANFLRAKGDAMGAPNGQKFHLAADQFEEIDKRVRANTAAAAIVQEPPKLAKPEPVAEQAPARVLPPATPKGVAMAAQSLAVYAGMADAKDEIVDRKRGDIATVIGMLSDGERKRALEEAKRLGDGPHQIAREALEERLRDERKAMGVPEPEAPKADVVSLDSWRARKEAAARPENDEPDEPDVPQFG